MVNVVSVVVLQLAPFESRGAAFESRKFPPVQSSHHYQRNSEF